MKCPKCGNAVSQGIPRCDSCGFSISPTAKKENVAAGIVGAFLGALLGGGCIMLFNQLGKIAAFSGWVLAGCTLKGYEWLGGRLSKKGVVIAILFMAFVPYLADRADWAIIVAREWKEYGVTFAQAFAMVPELLKDGTIDPVLFGINILLVYVFTIMGAFSTVRNVFRK